MKFASNSVLGLSMIVGALIAAVGLGAQSNDVAGHLQAAPTAPVHVTAEPPPPPSPPPPPPPTTLSPNDDYWTGQGDTGAAPGGGGG
jgi:hypothetical protein